MKKRSRNVLGSERGFTLIELGVVMAIIAILAAITYPTYKNIRERAYIAEAKAAMQEIRVEIWAGYVEDGNWPAAFNDTKYPATNWKLEGKETGSAPNVKYQITAASQLTSGSLKDKILTLTLDTDGKAEFVGPIDKS